MDRVSETERGWEEFKRKRLALNTFKAAAKAHAATRLCPGPRNAKNNVSLTLRKISDPSQPLKWQLPLRWSLFKE